MTIGSRLIIAAALALALAGCANKEINTIAKADADWALADAKAHSDTELVPCYQAVDDGASADLAAGGQPPGVLSVLQRSRDECQSLSKIIQACQPAAKAAPITYGIAIGALAKACSQAP